MQFGDNELPADVANALAKESASMVTPPGDTPSVPEASEPAQPVP